MAIEIIRKGTPPAERKYKTTCPNCKTTFSFLQKDTSYKGDQRDGDYLAVDCPVCKTTRYVGVNTYIKPQEIDPY